MRRAQLTCTLVLSACVIAGGATGKPPKHPLAGQTLDFIASPTGEDSDAMRLTISSAVIDNGFGGESSRGEADMESDAGKDVIGYVRGLGHDLADTGILAAPVGKGVAAPPYSFSLKFAEHVVYRMGDNVGHSLVAGLTFGLAAPTTVPVTYVSETTLDVKRVDGTNASYSCAARLKAAAPRDYKPHLEFWAPLRASARDQCKAELFDKMKEDHAFFHA